MIVKTREFALPGATHIETVINFTQEFVNGELNCPLLRASYDADSMIVPESTDDKRGITFSFDINNGSATILFKSKSTNYDLAHGAGIGSYNITLKTGKNIEHVISDSRYTFCSFGDGNFYDKAQKKASIINIHNADNTFLYFLLKGFGQAERQGSFRVIHIVHKGVPYTGIGHCYYDNQTDATINLTDITLYSPEGSALSLGKTFPFSGNLEKGTLLYIPSTPLLGVGDTSFSLGNFEGIYSCSTLPVFNSIGINDSSKSGYTISNNHFVEVD